MRTLTLSGAFLLALALPATAMNPKDDPPPVVEYYPWGDGYCDHFGYDFIILWTKDGLPIKLYLSFHLIRQEDPLPPVLPLWNGWLGPSTTMTLNTDDPPPVMTLNTDDPPPDKGGSKPPDAPKDPPKPPDTSGTDVVPVVGDLGGPVTPETDGGKPAPKPDTSGAPIGVRVTGSDSGETFAFLGPEHALPGSGPAKLDGGYDAGFAGCTTGIDKTCSFSVAHNQLGAYRLGTLALSGSHPILNFATSNHLAAPPASDDSCRSKQRSEGGESNAMAGASASRQRAGIGSELPVVSIRLRDVR